MHIFKGSWITNGEFSRLRPRNVFHRHLDRKKISCKRHRDRHILFRKTFELEQMPQSAVLYISADDYYKLWINGRFVAMGPASGYPGAYCYNEIDVSSYLQPGRNVIAVHTLYQGLINRVWVSGDLRHGLLLDLVADGSVIVKSDRSFRVKRHRGFREEGTAGYRTQFLEFCDSRVREVGFEAPFFNDLFWPKARVRKYMDYQMADEPSEPVVLEKIAPVSINKKDVSGFCSVTVDFGSIYVGYLNVKLRGRRGSIVTIREAQDINSDGSLRYHLRANCVYEEHWKLSGGEDRWDSFEYKSFRYAEVILPPGTELLELSLTARHYPFRLMAARGSKLSQDPRLDAIWTLCVHSQQYGVQEAILDCMEREKGFYMGDGCYTALTHMILTHDDAMVRKLIDDGFRSEFIADTLITCLDGSLMQEIAEFPLMLVFLVLWHYRLSGDRAYLTVNYPKVLALLEAYRRHYEKDGLLQDLDKWCVVEWPDIFRDGYDVDLTQGQVCHEPHFVMNAYYYEAIGVANKMAAALGYAPYRDAEPLKERIIAAFYDRERHCFKDSARTCHSSYVSNVFGFGFGLAKGDAEFETVFFAALREKGIHSLSLFGSFPLLMGLVRRGHYDMVTELLLDEGAWLRMLSEGATTTFESWSKDAKDNLSLFHMTLSDAAVFLSDADLEKLFE